MKKKQQKLTWHSFNDVFGKVSKKKEFQRAYKEEIVRLKLAKQIRELRTAHQMTQRVVAQRSGMPQSVIARIESGDRGISVDTLGRVAHTLGREVQLV
jgi:ribosome-binding protein aMBF1 (putative translation factor)